MTEAETCVMCHFFASGTKTFDFLIDHCIDGVKNADETGVDCGGSCTYDCGEF